MALGATDEDARERRRKHLKLDFGALDEEIQALIRCNDISERRVDRLDERFRKACLLREGLLEQVNKQGAIVAGVAMDSAVGVGSCGAHHLGPSDGCPIVFYIV